MKLKKNQKKKKYLKIFLLASLAVLTIVVGKKMVSTLHETVLTLLKPESFSITFSDVYSPHVKQAISHFVTQKITKTEKNDFSPRAICDNLCKEFAIISTISWKMLSPKHLLINISGIKPAYVVNNMIVGKNKKILNPESFVTYNSKLLKHISIPASFYDSTIKQSMYDFLEKIPENVWIQYSIEYHRSSEIVLRNKQKTDTPLIIANEKNILNEKKIKNLALVESNMQQRECGPLKNKNPKQYQLAYDIRFENRVIVKMFKKKRWRRGK